MEYRNIDVLVIINCYLLIMLLKISSKIPKVLYTCSPNRFWELHLYLVVQNKIYQTFKQ